jgi:hypothetical protein
MKKFTALFLVFSLMMLSTSLYAKERRRAKLIVTKKDGQQIEGELITVKPTSLLLLNTDGKDESVDIADIRIITVVKKSKAWLGFGIGFLAGASIATLVLILGDWMFDGTEWYVIIPALAGLGSGIIGGTVGANAGKDKTFQIEGMTDSEIQETLDKLRKKARVRNYK